MEGWGPKGELPIDPRPALLHHGSRASFCDVASGLDRHQLIATTRRQAVTVNGVARSARWAFQLAAEFGHRDITPDLESFVTDSGIRTGVLVVQLIGSTGAITTIEYEPGALDDLRRALDLIASADQSYAHNARWGDGNGFSHVRSAVLKTSLAIPIVDAALALGQWQQVVALNLDNRARQRQVVAVACGTPAGTD